MAANHKIVLMDLPTELRMDIIEHSNFKDLLNVSRAMPLDRNIIARLFRKMLKNQTFDVVFDHRYNTGVEVHYGRKSVDNSLHKFAEILEFLHHFGHCISKHKISYHSYKNETNLKLIHE